MTKQTFEKLKVGTTAIVKLFGGVYRIKVIELTEKTIKYDNLDTGAKSIRTTIDDFRFQAKLLEIE